MPAFFIAQDDTQLRVVDIAFFAPPSAIIVNEDHSLAAEPTEFPVESGATITDHIRPVNPQLTIDARVTMTPHAIDLFMGAGRVMPLVITAPKPYDPLRRGPPPGTPGFVTRGTMAAIQGRLTPVVVSALTTQFPIPFDPVITTYNKLAQFVETGTFIKALTNRRDYEGMVIVGLTMRVAPQAKVADFSVTLRRIKTVSLQLVTAPVPLEPKGEPALKKGNQPPSPEGETANPEARRSLLRSSIEAMLPGLLPTL